MSDKRSLGFFLELVRSLRTSWRLIWDRRVPLWTKFVPLATAAYLVWPMDLLADPMLGLGQLDDIALILLASRLFIKLAPPAVVAELEGSPVMTAQDTEGVVDADYEVIDES